MNPGHWELLQSTGIYVMRPDGTGLRRITRPGGVAGSPAWSPDGKSILFYETDEVGAYMAKTARSRTEFVSVDVSQRQADAVHRLEPDQAVADVPLRRPHRLCGPQRHRRRGRHQDLESRSPRRGRRERRRARTQLGARWRTPGVRARAQKGDDRTLHPDGKHRSGVRALSQRALRHVLARRHAAALQPVFERRDEYVRHQHRDHERGWQRQEDLVSPGRRLRVRSQLVARRHADPVQHRPLFPRARLPALADRDHQAGRHWLHADRRRRRQQRFSPRGRPTPGRSSTSMAGISCAATWPMATSRS